MSDKEKVVNGLRCCSEMNGEHCRKCPYQDECRDGYGIPHLANDALELLEKRCNALEALEQRCKALEALEKRNEPMLMTNIGDTADGIEVGICPACNKSLVNDLRRPTKYCKFCGQAVRWSE